MSCGGLLGRFTPFVVLLNDDDDGALFSMVGRRKKVTGGFCVSICENGHVVAHDRFDNLALIAPFANALSEHEKIHKDSLFTLMRGVQQMLLGTNGVFPEEEGVMGPGEMAGCG